MKDNFTQAQRILRQNNKRIHIQAVNGCCYGRDNKPDKGTYYKYCGQKFWTFISGDENLYQEIIKPLGYRARQKNEKFTRSYVQVVNQFTFSFMERFCEDGVIQWDEVILLNSAERSPAKTIKRVK